MELYDKSDFEIFNDQTLQGRLGKIRQFIDPKFEMTGNQLQGLFNSQGLTVFQHVAKHARRTVNPPVDTWIAFGPNKRGYKKDPHFELGFWDDRMFLKLCLLSESKANPFNAKYLADSETTINQISDCYGVSADHTKKGMGSLELTEDYIEKYTNVKSAEFMVGIEWMEDDSFFKDSHQFEIIQQSIKDLIDIYKIWVIRV